MYYSNEKIQALRVILSSLQAKAKERKWMKHQTSGEMDDSKLIESEFIVVLLNIQFTCRIFLLEYNVSSH